VNVFRLDKEDPIEILEVDNSAVRESQIIRLQKLKKERNPEEVHKALEAMTMSAKTGKATCWHFHRCCPQEGYTG